MENWYEWILIGISSWQIGVWAGRLTAFIYKRIIK